jgi:hypothetical protein
MAQIRKKNHIPGKPFGVFSHPTSLYENFNSVFNSVWLQIICTMIFYYCRSRILFGPNCRILFPSSGLFAGSRMLPDTLTPAGTLCHRKTTYSKFYKILAKFGHNGSSGTLGTLTTPLRSVLCFEGSLAILFL